MDGMSMIFVVDENMGGCYKYRYVFFTPDVVRSDVFALPDRTYASLHTAHII